MKPREQNHYINWNYTLLDCIIDISVIVYVILIDESCNVNSRWAIEQIATTIAC